MAKITLRQVEELIMVGTDSNNHSVVIGKKMGEPGEWVGVKPSELLLMAAASCSAYDVIEILTKQRQPFHDLQVVCEGSQRPEQPSYFTKIHLHFVVTGKGVPAAAVERAVAMSHEKYCSATIMLSKTAEVSTSFEVVEG